MTHLVIAEYKPELKNGKRNYRKGSKTLVSEHATLEEARAERDRHVREYGDELDSTPIIALKIE